MKSKLSLDEAADQIATVVEKHLAKLPPAEKKRRIQKAHERVERLVERRKWN